MIWGFCGKMQISLSIESGSQMRKGNDGKSEPERRKQEEGGGEVMMNPCKI